MLSYVSFVIGFHCEASEAFTAPVIVVSQVFLIVQIQSTFATVGLLTSGAMVFPSDVVEHVVNVLFVFTLLLATILIQYLCNLKNIQELLSDLLNNLFL